MSQIQNIFGSNEHLKATVDPVVTKLERGSNIIKTFGRNVVDMLLMAVAFALASASKYLVEMGEPLTDEEINKRYADKAVAIAMTEFDVVLLEAKNIDSRIIAILKNKNYKDALIEAGIEFKDDINFKPLTAAEQIYVAAQLEITYGTIERILAVTYGEKYTEEQVSELLEVTFTRSTLNGITNNLSFFGTNTEVAQG